MNTTPSPKRRRRGLWWKIPVTLLLLLVIVLAVVWFRLSPIATSVANRMLPDVLATGASVERIVLKPARGLAEIHGLRIDQPDGFGDGQVIELALVLAEIDMGSLGSADGILVRAVEVQGLTANITKDAEGVLNAMRLGPPPSAEDAEDPVGAGADNSGPAEGDAAAPFPGLRIGRVSIADVALNYRDESTGEKPIEIALGNLGIEITDGQVTLDEGPEVRLGSGTVTLEDIQIAQPAGFGDDALLTFPRLHLELGAEPFVDNVVRLQRLEAEGLRASIVRDTNGVMNASRLGGGPPPPPPAEPVDGEVVAESENDAATVLASAEEDKPPAGSPVGVHLAELALTDFGVTYRDATLGDAEPFECVIQDLHLSITDLMAFLAEPPAPSSPVTLEAGIDQGEHPDVLLSVLATVGPIGAGVPDVNLQATISGFMLDTLGSLVPRGARKAVGANGMDLQAGLKLTATHIDLEGQVETDAGHGYPVGVKGPLDGPEVDLGPIAMAVAGRLTGGVANLATGTAGAAVDVAKGLSGGATDVAKGATDAVGNVGGGLFKSAKAVLTLDVKEAGTGLKEATVDTAKEAGKAVDEAGGSVMADTKESMGNVTGSKATGKWLEGIESRHTLGVDAARVALAKMPFPPVAPEGAAAEEAAP